MPTVKTTERLKTRAVWLTSFYPPFSHRRNSKAKELISSQVRIALSLSGDPPTRLFVDGRNPIRRFLFPVVRFDNILRQTLLLLVLRHSTA